MTEPDINTVQENEQLQRSVIHYLYGEMDLRERTSFEKELSTNQKLKKMLFVEQELQNLVPKGAQPFIDDDRMQGNRWVVREKLRQRNSLMFVLNRWWHDLLQRPVVLISQLAAMTATFALGFMIADDRATTETLSLENSSIANNSSFPTARISPLLFIGEEDYEIYQLQVDQYDAANGEIELSFALASETRVRGNVSDPGISRLMTVALQNDIGTSARLDTIEALQPISAGSDVFQALVYTLKNDPNPGVRYQAVHALTSLAHEETVREGLRYALSEDVNVGVRVEAFNALQDYPDDKTLETFRQRIEADSNNYIRTRAREIVANSGLETKVL